MNGVQTMAIRGGWPATAVVRLAGGTPLKVPERQQVAGDELLLASVTHPPRTGQTQPIAALMPQVLAQYGLTDQGSDSSDQHLQLDVLA